MKQILYTKINRSQKLLKVQNPNRYLNHVNFFLFLCILIVKIIQQCVKLLQIDLHYDISGFLSAHPHTPFLSLHHLDTVDPIFPSMTRSNSVSHLMKAAKADQSRLLQQTICYYKPKNWSFSISWGYSAQIYEKTQPQAFYRDPWRLSGLG